jgi:heat shock protein HslJ
MKVGRLITLLAILLAIAGCGDRGTSTPIDIDSSGGGDNPLRGRTFQSTTVNENGQPRTLVARTTIRFVFTKEDRLLVDAGCNTINGPVRVGGGHLEVTDLGVTGIGCDNQLHEQDKWLSAFVAGKPSWRLDGTNLVVSSASTDMIMADRTEPNLALRDTRWIVETIVDGQAAASTPVVAEASLVFDKSTVTVETGCNRFAGNYVLSGNVIRFASIGATKKVCDPERKDQENAILAVLGDEVTYEIEANQLFLRLPSNTGINLRAKR